MSEFTSLDDMDETRDIAEVPAIELINTVSVHLLSAAAVKLGLADGPDAESEIDLDEARKLITALAGLVTAAAGEIGDHHARPLRDGLRSLQLAFREASSCGRCSWPSVRHPAFPMPRVRARARSSPVPSTEPPGSARADEPG